MKSFEEYLAREKYMSESRDNAANRRRAVRTETRMEKQLRKTRIAYILAIIVWAIVVVALLTHAATLSRAVGEDTTPPEKPAEAAETAIAEANRQALDRMLQENAEISREFYEDFKESVEPKEATPMDDAITMLAKLIWGEARGCSTTEQAAVVWNVLNRVDHPNFGDSIEEVILYPNAYDGYDPSNPVLEDHMRIAEDVIDRWTWEKWDGGDYGRVLPKAYLFFHGDGKVNWFRMEYEHTGEYWDWSFESPYEEE